ncbi:MAG TPA: hypothetical protein EYP78_01190 [Candidatus Omnitrophica bacterium]|nr:hypothetical protein [Candidatus Omnitrophota bacterium]
MKKANIFSFLIVGILLFITSPCLFSEGKRLVLYLGEFNISPLPGGALRYQRSVDWNEIEFSPYKEVWKKNIEELFRKKEINPRVTLLSSYRMPVVVNGQPYSAQKQEGTKAVFITASLRDTNFRNIYKYNIKLRKERIHISASPLIYSRAGMIRPGKTILFYSLATSRSRVLKVTLLHLGSR